MTFIFVEKPNKLKFKSPPYKKLIFCTEGVAK